MTPYVRSILQYVSVPVLLGVIGKVYSLYRDLPVPPEFFWAGVILLVVGVLVVHYGMVAGDLHDQAGFYVRVRSVKAAADRTFEDLGVKKYLPFYCPRPEDEAVRQRLKERHGVLVTGVPLGGKTRTALEAIAAKFPNAFLLRVDPDNLTVDKVGKFIVPCLWVFFRKPTVVVFLDKIDAPLDAGRGQVIDKLLNRLSDQTSAVYVAATCDEGRLEAVRKTLRDSPHGHLFEPARLEQLSNENADKIYVSVWKDGNQPLLRDRTQPGYIVFGSSPISGKIGELAEEDRKLVKALRLAAICETGDCPESIFWGIAEDVLGLKTDRGAHLKRLAEEHLLVVQGKEPYRKIFVQHLNYLDEAYVTAEEFHRDLARFTDWLAAKKDARRLDAVAWYYWVGLRDLASARRAFDKLAVLADAEPDHLMHCSAFYAAVGEQKARADMHARALALVPDQRDRARLLIGLGDIFLYRIRWTADAMTSYNDAYHQVETIKDDALVDLIRRRSGDTYLVARNYADARPYFDAWHAQAKGDDLLDAADRLAFANIGLGDDAKARTVLGAAWKDLSSGARLDRALKFLDSAEACLGDDRLIAAGAITASFYAPGVTTTKERTRECVTFGYFALCRGFLRVSQKVHADLAALPASVLDPEDRINVHINLGYSQFLLGDLAAAEAAYQKVLSLAGADPKLKPLGSGGASGLGDVALRKGDIAGAKLRYQSARAMTKALRRDNLDNWANQGLADVAIAERNFEEAQHQLAKVDVTIDSYQQYVRVWMARARVALHFGKWIEAESFIHRGLALPLRSDFATVAPEFQKLQAELDKQKAASAG